MFLMPECGVVGSNQCGNVADDKSESHKNSPRLIIQFGNLRHSTLLTGFPSLV